MEIKEVPDDLSSPHRAALENMCQNFLNYGAEPVNQDSNSAITPLSLQKGKYSSINHSVIKSISQPTNPSINQSINKSITSKNQCTNQSINH